jgi:hypothetical protein
MQTNIQRATTLLIEKSTPEFAEVSADIHIGVTGLPAPGGSETPEKTRWHHVHPCDQKLGAVLY